jgi:hypothetical protein
MNITLIYFVGKDKMLSRNPVFFLIKFANTIIFLYFCIVSVYIRLCKATLKTYIMKTSKSLFFGAVLFLLFPFHLLSENIEIQTAKNAAVNLYSERYGSNLVPPQISEIIFVKEKSEIVYYIFNFTKPAKGFVIVSADDVAIPILGYSFENEYNAEDIPPQLELILTEYRTQIFKAKVKKTEPDIMIKEEWQRLSVSPESFKGSKSADLIGPLLSTKWNQNWPYNEMCPADANGPGGHAYAGCVATAMAQVMKYWSNPEHGTGSYGYSHYLYGYLSANFANATYNYANMPASISSSNTDVATLMYHCGIAVEMNYGPSSSGSNLDGYHGARNGLVNYFKYDEDALYAEKIDFEDTVWRSMILDNLEQGYPIIYGGWNPSTWTGHAWNLDGFEKVGDLYHYHMNWGWGGSYNGYYYLDDLTPGSQEYTLGQEAIFNIHPYASNLAVCYPQNSDYWTGTTNTTAKTQNSLAIAATPEAGWMSFDVSGIPDGAFIYAVSFNGYVYERNKPDWYITPVSGDPVTMSASDLHSDIIAEQGAGYYFHHDETIINYPVDWRQYMLGGDASSDLNSILSSDKFTVGIANDYGSAVRYIRFHGWNETNKPYLYVYYAAFGNLEGYVTEYGTSTPVANVMINIGHFSVLSGSDGHFLIENIPIGNYDVTVDANGSSNGNGNPFFNDTIPATITCGETTQLNIGMKWAEIDVNPASINVQIDPYEIKTETFTITNNGPGTLSYTSFVAPPLGDILADLNIEETSGDDVLYGAEFDGTYIWATGRVASNADHQLYKFDRDGNLITQYSQGTTSTFGMKKMTFDGTFLYSYDMNGFYRINPADGSVTTLFTDFPDEIFEPVGIGWIPGLGFITFKNGSDFIIFDETGALVTHLNNPTSTYFSDITYDSINDCLWFAGQPNYTIYQYDYHNEVFTGLSWLLPNLEGSTYQSANGICISNTFIENTLTICGVTQANPDNRFFALEVESWLSITGNRTGFVNGTTKESTDVTLSIDAGALTVASKTSEIAITHNAGENVTVYVTITNNYTHGSISGYITKFGTSTPIANATVSMGGLSDISDATGFYEIDNIPVGVYDLTVTHNDYINDTITNYPVTGLSDQKNIGLKWIEASANPLTYNTTLPPGSTFNTILSVSNTGTGEMNYSCSVSYPENKSDVSILVVDRDMSDFDYFGDEEYPYDEWGAYQEMLENNGFTYTYYKVWVPWDNGPPLATLQNYDLVIWFTGEINGEDVLTPDDENNLGTYLSNGGNLFLASWSYLNYYGDGDPVSFDPGTFAYDYLGMRNADLEALEVDWTSNMTGVAGSFAEGYSIDIEEVFYEAMATPAKITNHTGDDLFNVITPEPGGIAATQLDAGNHKVVYSGVSFSMFENATVRDNVFADMMDYFGGGGWLHITSNGSGVIEGNSKASVDVGLLFDATNLAVGTYTADIVINSNDPDSPLTIPVTLNVSDAPGVDIKVFLEGPFNGTAMNKKLSGLSAFPLSQPYSVSPWNYSGTETVTIVPPNVVDWILVEFRDAADATSANSSTRISRQAAFLLSDGSIRGLDGVSYLQLNGSVTQNLFVVISHRNHLEILSANAVTISGGNYFYDFSTGADKVYGGLTGYNELSAGIFGMAAGNGVPDLLIDINDKTTWATEAGEWGYYQGDFNLDGNIDNKDKNDYWTGNEGKECQMPQ